MVPIGFSLGCFYKFDIPYEDKVEFCLRSGATALELNFGTVQRLLAFEPSMKFIDTVNRFLYVSIHLPSMNIQYGNDPQTQKIIEKLIILKRVIKLDGIVLHPDVVNNFSLFAASGLPICIENMDIHKKSGITPKEFAEFNSKYKFDYVLDLQHSFEHDPTMKLVDELHTVMGKRLHQLHVSGQTAVQNHAPVFASENKEAILKSLKNITTVPIILEGAFPSLDIKLAKKELDTIRQAL